PLQNTRNAKPLNKKTPGTHAVYKRNGKPEIIMDAHEGGRGTEGLQLSHSPQQSLKIINAQHRNTFIEERYGKYNISDPLMALQRDFEMLKVGNHGEKQPVCSNPLSILKVVMKHCKNMQERMLSQLAAAESRHRKLEFERTQVKKFEKEQKKLSSQLEEERARHKQLSSMLVLECKKATAKVVEEGQKAGELSLKLEKERSKVSQLEEELASKKKRSLQMEAQVEKQLSEFDIEREQLRAKLNREENRTKALKEEVESLKKALKELEVPCQGTSPAEHSQQNPSMMSRGVETESPLVRSVSCQTESSQADRTNLGNTGITAHMALPSPLVQTDIAENQALLREKPIGPVPESPVENGSSPVRTESPVYMIPQLPSGGTSLSPSSTAASSLTSSPCSSPVLTKRLVGASGNSPGYQSSYQVGINQRFHAARHKFQSQADQDHQSSGVQSPPSRDLSPTLADNSAAKQLARNTVTQVLSRFTSQQGPINESSPGKVSSPLSPLSPGIKSPTIPRAERGNPPPIPPKKPGLAQSPATPTPLTKTPSQASSLGATMDLASSCSNNAVVANGKDIDILSRNSAGTPSTALQCNTLGHPLLLEVVSFG
uniref:CTTNBP2 N-terminal like n=1 Tax=Chelonoidis abingdonii TaxID=106734 RepID=A0A8C0GJE8_CHEAB